MNFMSFFHVSFALIFLTVAVILLGRSGFFGGIDTCSEMEYGASRDECFVDVAIRERDESLCDEISDDGVKYPCYSAVAVLKRDISICMKLPEDEKVQCTTLFRGSVG